MVRTSYWSCVTKTKAMLRFSWRCYSSICTRSKLEVERTQWLNEQQELGLIDDRTTERDALLLTEESCAG